MKDERVEGKLLERVHFFKQRLKPLAKDEDVNGGSQNTQESGYNEIVQLLYSAESDKFKLLHAISYMEDIFKEDQDDDSHVNSDDDEAYWFTMLL